MDDPPENRQQEEITALKSIYGDDFIDCPPPKAWKVRHAFSFVMSKGLTLLDREHHDYQSLLSEFDTRTLNTLQRSILIYMSSAYCFSAPTEMMI